MNGGDGVLGGRGGWLSGTKVGDKLGGTVTMTAVRGIEGLRWVSYGMDEGGEVKNNGGDFERCGEKVGST